METLKKKRLDVEKAQAEKERGYKPVKVEKEDKVDIKQSAFEAIQKGETLEGYTMEETKKLSGGYISKKGEKKYLFKLPPQDRFKVKQGWFGRKKKVEAFDEKTFAILKDIKTEGDLKELIEKRKEFEAQGIDVRKIVDYFMTEEEE